MKQKLAVIASDFGQELLIEKAKEMGIYTVCFANEGEEKYTQLCDEFYLISIIEKEEIYKICKRIGINGIMSIGFDLAMASVNYVAEHLGLPGNSMETSLYSTNKAEMRKVLKANNLPIPRFHICKNINDNHNLDFPFMVKAVASSSSRGVRLVNNTDEYISAYNDALNYSKNVILEEYFEGRQFSVEMLSQDGKHEFIGLTEEFYSGPPYFVEENYITPGRLKDNLLVQLIEVVSNSLDAINYKNGASHIEIRINDYNEFCIIEIAGRMGATRSEFIEIAYGIDYMKALLNVAMNEDYELKTKNTISFAYMKLIKNERELELLNKLSKAGDLEYYGIKSNVDKTAEVVNMTKAWGYFIKKEDTLDKCLEYINY